MTSARATVILEQLGDGGRRRTSPRAAVIAAALRRTHPFTAQQLVRSLARSGIGRATVFRTLDLLVSEGVLARIHGIEHGSRCVRYTACGPTHHHHLMCRSCGRVEEIRASGLEERIDALARARGFEPLGHGIEIQGICSECRA
ncbi:MAG: transcriptional repressor [Chloroflexi bacterium]|nr:MAG: transcriptional repressor [Chloroflexota bacterium]TMB94264.1 MAG: transcriptional repressor [Chloroflexota bacterium]TMC25168.1 MAG: transcriptional repressor [Chloroflexota bacterium]TMC54496.1 MAG: transcriptional repressor [Chloroflexota bacterium]TME39480.1 MAG: transcriptional repressor [Chloroflexota bacterium]